MDLQLTLTPTLSRKPEKGRALRFIGRRAVAAVADRGYKTYGRMRASGAKPAS